MKSVIAIDPGPEESAVLVKSGGIIQFAEVVTNEGLLSMAHYSARFYGAEAAAIEMIASYGMPVGKEVFETCVFIGEIREAFRQSGIKSHLVYRKDIKLNLCGTTKAKDANIRQALIDKLGIVGTKSAPGPLYGIKSHLWAALAVADYALEKL